MERTLGIFLKMLRIERGEIMLQMAEKLGVSTAFLSNVENGKKPMPKQMFDKICKFYQLTVQQIDELESLMIDACNEIKLNLNNVNNQNKNLAVVFARTFEELDDDTSEQIMKILKRKRKVLQ